jgi:hypothetical protein
MTLNKTATGSFFRAGGTDGNNGSTLQITGAATKLTASARGTLTFGAAALGGSTISSTEGDVSANITGAAIGSRLLAEGGTVVGQIGGAATGLFAEAAVDVTLSVTGDLTASRIFSDEGSGGNVILTVGKKVAGSVITSGSEDVSATIGGDLLGSRLFAIESEVSVNVGGNVIGSQLTGSSVSATVSGNLAASVLQTNDSDISLSVGGTTTKTDFAAGNSFTGSFTGDALDVLINSGNTTNITAAKNFKGRVYETTGVLTFLATGNVLPGSIISSAGNARVTAAKFDGTLNANLLDFATTGTVGAIARIQADTVTDINADNIGFSVGGDFAGRLAVAGSFTTGTGASATVVTGTVQPTAAWAIAGSIFQGATKYVFGKGFLGVLQVGGDINPDIDFGGNVNTIFVGEQINGDLTVLGKVASIVSGTFFTATDAFDGTFRDGAGNVLAALDTTTGHGRVTSTL